MNGGKNKDEALAEFLTDSLAEWKRGEVRIRKMFGGRGVYCGELMFALIADGSLYLKVDDESRPRFESEGLTPFVYDSERGRVTMSYYLAPDAIFDNQRVLEDWAGEAQSASVRSASAPKRKKKK